MASTTPLFLLPVLTSILYCVCRCLESYYFGNRDQQPLLEDDDPESHHIPLKLVVRESILVFLACLAANAAVLFFRDHAKQLMNVVTETKNLLPETTPMVFMDQPDF